MQVRPTLLISPSACAAVRHAASSSSVTSLELSESAFRYSASISCLLSSVPKACCMR